MNECKGSVGNLIRLGSAAILCRMTVEKPPARAQLRAWRIARDLSQAAAGALIGVEQATWSRWESGVWTPEGANRDALEILTGIPRPEWSSREERATVRRARKARKGISKVRKGIAA